MEKYQPQPLFNVENYLSDAKLLRKHLTTREKLKTDFRFCALLKDREDILRMDVHDEYSDRLHLQDDGKEVEVDIHCGYSCEIHYNRNNKCYEHIIDDSDYETELLSRRIYQESYINNNGKEEYTITSKYFLGTIGKEDVVMTAKTTNKNGKTTKQYFISYQNQHYEIGYNGLPVDDSPICMAILKKVKPGCIEYLNDEYGYECTDDDSLVELVDERLYNGPSDILDHETDGINSYIADMSDGMSEVVDKVVYNKESDWVTDPYFNGYYERLDDGDDYDYRDDDDDDRPMTEDEYYDAVAEGEIDEGWDGGMFRR